MTTGEFLALLMFCTAMSFSPGPNTTLSTALAANHGLRHALRFCLAVPTGWTMLLLATGLGLGALVTSVPALELGHQAFWRGLHVLAGVQARQHPARWRRSTARVWT